MHGTERDKDIVTMLCTRPLDSQWPSRKAAVKLGSVSNTRKGRASAGSMYAAASKPDPATLDPHNARSEPDRMHLPGEIRVLGTKGSTMV